VELQTHKPPHVKDLQSQLHITDDFTLASWQHLLLFMLTRLKLEDPYHDDPL
jgi:hypothetical protein